LSLGDAATKPRARRTQPSKPEPITANGSDDDSDLNLSYPPARARSSKPVKAKRKVICDESGDEDDNNERKTVLPSSKKYVEKTKENVMGQELITKQSAANQLKSRIVKRRPRIVPINIPSDIEEEDEEDEDDAMKTAPSKKRSRDQDEEDSMRKKRPKDDPRKEAEEPSKPKKRVRKAVPVARGDDAGAGLEP
jgi:hypothetical protein